MATTVGVSSSFLSGDGRPILEPGALFVDGNYALRLNAWCSVAGVTIALRSRFLRSNDGELVPSGDTIALTSNRLLNTTDVQLAIGFPLNVQVFAQAGTPTVGQCFVQVQIVYGDGAAAFPLATVLQGYVTTTQSLSWPGSPIVNSLEGSGALINRSLANGGPGVDPGFVVPVNTRWSVIGYRGDFTTSAAAGTRNPTVTYNDLTALFARSTSAAAQGPGTTFSYQWMASFGSKVVDSNNVFSLSLPLPSELAAAWQIGFLTGGILVGDQWTGIEMAAREWLDL